MGRKTINIQRDVVSREYIQNGLPRTIEEITIQQDQDEETKPDAQSEIIQEPEDDKTAVQPEEPKKKSGRTAKGNG